MTPTPKPHSPTLEIFDHAHALYTGSSAVCMSQCKCMELNRLAAHIVIATQKDNGLVPIVISPSSRACSAKGVAEL